MDAQVIIHTNGISDIQLQLLMAGLTESLNEMDLLKIESLLDDDILIDNGSKWEFLSILGERFYFFRSLGAVRLQQKEEICILCKRGCPVTFFEAQPGKGIGFYFEKQDGQVKDIIICNGSTGTFLSTNDKLHWYNKFDFNPNV